MVAPVFTEFANNSNFQTFGPAAVSAANSAGIDSNVFISLIGSESSFNPSAMNGSAVGIAQFLPTTAAMRGINPFDPVSALNGSAGYLSSLYNKYGNYQDAIAAYKGGVDSPLAQSQAASVLTNAGVTPGNQYGTGDEAAIAGLPKAQQQAITGNAATNLWDNIVKWFGAHAYVAIFIVIGIVAIVFSVRNAFTPAKSA